VTLWLVFASFNTLSLSTPPKNWAHWPFSFAHRLATMCAAWPEKGMGAGRHSNDKHYQNKSCSRSIYELHGRI
jgi:hypothetical protein